MPRNLSAMPAAKLARHARARAAVASPEELAALVQELAARAEALAAVPRFYVATAGEAAAWATGCAVAVQAFACPLAYGRAIRAAEKAHEKGDADSFTYGDLTPYRGRL